MSLANKNAIGNYTVGVKKSLIGAKVVNAEGEDLGKVEDVVLDARDYAVVYAILSFDGFLGLGGKHFALPWGAVHFDPARHEVVLDLHKDRIKNAPGFDKDDWPEMGDPDWATRVHKHYGQEPYWERH
jgi:PRC-barrel domain